MGVSKIAGSLLSELRLRGFLSLVVLLAVCVASPPLPDDAYGECPAATELGIDTAYADTFVVALLGRVWGQAFYAPHTAVKSITVWRRPVPPLNLDPMQLWITKAEPDGRPLLDEILLEGPAIVITEGAPRVAPDRVRYEFEPPFELPEVGTYWFGVKEAWCSAAFQLLATTLDVSPELSAWRLEPATQNCLGIGCCPDDYDQAFDLIYTIEFCDGAIQIDSGSWGRVKATYR